MALFMDCIMPLLHTTQQQILLDQPFISELGDRGRAGGLVTQYGIYHVIIFISFESHLLFQQLIFQNLQYLHFTT